MLKVFIKKYLFIISKNGKQFQGKLCFVGLPDQIAAAKLCKENYQLCKLNILLVNGCINGGWSFGFCT